MLLLKQIRDVTIIIAKFLSSHYDCTVILQIHEDCFVKKRKSPMLLIVPWLFKVIYCHLVLKFVSNYENFVIEICFSGHTLY